MTFRVPVSRGRTGVPNIRGIITVGKVINHSVCELGVTIDGLVLTFISRSVLITYPFLNVTIVTSSLNRGICVELYCILQTFAPIKKWHTWHLVKSLTSSHMYFMFQSQLEFSCEEVYQGSTKTLVWGPPPPIAAGHLQYDHICACVL